MEAQYRTRNGRLVFKIEAGTPKDLFEGIADLQEVYEADDACGICKSTDIRFRVREVQSNKYYEMRCAGVDPRTGFACNAQLSFGQNKVGGGLFPKRKDGDGNWLPNRGWFKYVAKEGA